MQHLLIVAEKLQLSGPDLNGGAGRISPYVDQPLPSPPGLSPIWIGLAVVGLVVGLFALTGGFGNNQPSLDPTPFWQQDKTAKDSLLVTSKSKDAVGPGNSLEAPASLKGPQEARNAGELVSLLRQAHPHIKLKPGVTYDLTRTNSKDAFPMEALFEGNDHIDRKRSVDRQADLFACWSPRATTANRRGLVP